MSIQVRLRRWLTMLGLAAVTPCCATMIVHSEVEGYRDQAFFFNRAFLDGTRLVLLAGPKEDKPIGRWGTVELKDVPWALQGTDAAGATLARIVELHDDAPPDTSAGSFVPVPLKSDLAARAE